MITAVVLTFCGFFVSPVQAKYSGVGNGELNNPYRITTAANMNEIGTHPEDWDAHFILINDINLAELTGTPFNIIGTSSSSAFTGIFDGNENIISNLYINVPGTQFMGLFGFTNGSAEIRDLGLENASIHNSGSSSSTGALVGYNVGTIFRCYAAGNVTASECPGGLVGYNNSGTISDCYADVTVDGGGYSGGLVGYNNSGTIIDSYATGDVTGTGKIGGLLGVNDEGNVTGCRATGSVTQNCTDCFYAGGLVGRNYYGTINNCQASGTVNGSFVLGGLVGENYHSTISGCSASGTVDGEDTHIGGLVGANQKDSYIFNSFAKGNVIGDEVVGALAGGNTSESVIENCYATGSASGNSSVGGLVGSGISGEYVYVGCIWNSSLNPLLSGIGNVVPDPNGVVDKTTEQMQTMSTFTDVGWDFIGETTNGPNDIWRLCEDTNDYPRLAWQFLSGDFVCPDGVDMKDYAVLAEQWQRDVLASDIAPDGGDGIVNFMDWAVVADGWDMTTDIDDVAVLAEQWLQPSAYCADIAPGGGDGVVDWFDLKELAEDWLEGIE